MYVCLFHCVLCVPNVFVSIRWQKTSAFCAGTVRNGVREPVLKKRNLFEIYAFIRKATEQCSGSGTVKMLLLFMTKRLCKKKIPHFPTLSPHSVGFLSGSCSQKYEGKCVFFCTRLLSICFLRGTSGAPPPPRQVLERYLGKTSKKTEKLSEPYLFRYKKHCGRPKTYWGHNSR